MSLEQALVRAVQEKTQEVPFPGVDATSIIGHAHRRSRRRRALAALALTAVVGGAALQVAGVGPNQSDRVPLAQSTAWPLDEVTWGDNLPVGRYAAPFNGDDVEPGPWAELDVSAGFKKDFASTLRASNGRRLGLWRVATVNTNPCHGVDFTDPGPSVHDLAASLAAQPLLSGTQPVPVRLGGFPGLYLEQRVPADLDWRDCVTSLGRSQRDSVAPPVPLYYFEIWEEPGATVAWVPLGPGDTHRVWILDVNGDRLVVDATYGSTATVEQQQELTRLVRSIRFTQPPAEQR